MNNSKQIFPYTCGELTSGLRDTSHCAKNQIRKIIKVCIWYQGLMYHELLHLKKLVYTSNCTIDYKYTLVMNRSSFSDPERLEA